MIIIVRERDMVAIISNKGKIINGKTASIFIFLVLDLLEQGKISSIAGVTIVSEIFVIY